MLWLQRDMTLKARPRSFHLIDGEVLAHVPELAQVHTGLLHLWLQHTSASLTVNKNADPAVRQDFERFFNRLVPENHPDYPHTDEGPDDLPAHFKNSLLGCQVTRPVKHGRLNIGIWQGVYLGEHRNDAAGRILVATLQGQSFNCHITSDDNAWSDL